jgi:hypothetical protein
MQRRRACVGRGCSNARLRHRAPALWRLHYEYAFIDGCEGMSGRSDVNGWVYIYSRGPMLCERRIGYHTA